MSVCVAVACEMSTVLVTVTDRMWTHPHTSLQGSLKHAYVAPRWLALMAGDDISVGGEAVLHEMRTTCAELDQPAYSVPVIRDVLESAWQSVQKKVATAAVLAPMGMTMADFLRSRTTLGDALYSDLFRQVQERSRLQLQLLVCGFDETGRPGLLVHEDDFGCRDFSRIGCLSIGSGHTSALASLAFHNYESKCSLSEAIFLACSAKFMAERAPGVGSETIVACLKNDGQACWLFGSAIRHIRRMWERETMPKLPKSQEMSSLIDPMVSECGWKPL